jgi:hypothetical protein
METTGGLGALVRSARVNAAIAWAVLVGVVLLAAGHAVAGRVLWVGFAAAVLALAVVPPVVARTTAAMLPWEVLAVTALPLAGGVALPAATQPLASHLAVAALALVLAVELHLFTAVRLSDRFAVVFVVVATLATAGVWAVAAWLSDLLLGTALVPSLRALMIDFTAATVAGVAAGVGFTAYVRRLGAADARVPTDPPSKRARPTAEATAADRSPTDPAATPRTADPVGRRRAVERRQRLLARTLQFALVALLVAGLADRHLGVVVNCAAALVVTELPAVLERDYRLAADPGLVLWITGAVFVHAVGIAGPYDNVWWYDHLAHALSASVVAAVGYTAVRAVVDHSESVSVPPRLLAVFVLLVVVAAGVVWEVVEFLAAEFARATGVGDVLIQYGLTDTMLDLVFDVAGGLVVAVWGHASLAGPVETLIRWLDERSAR